MKRTRGEVFLEMYTEKKMAVRTARRPPIRKAHHWMMPASLRCVSAGGSSPMERRNAGTVVGVGLAGGEGGAAERMGLAAEVGCGLGSEAIVGGVGSKAERTTGFEEVEGVGSGVSTGSGVGVGLDAMSRARMDLSWVSTLSIRSESRLR